MSGPNTNDQAMQRILNKEGVEKGTPSLQKTPREKLDKASKPCKSGPGIILTHPHQLHDIIASFS